jgi:hypothetical protein
MKEEIRKTYYENGNIETESILIESVDKWLNNNKESSIEKVVFIDKRGGFNNCTKSIQWLVDNK